MMFLHHPMGNASSASLCLLESRRKPRGSEESIHLSPSHGKAYQSRKPRLRLNQKEHVDLRGGSFMASVLRQLVYGSQKVSNVELFVAEEKRAALQNRSSFYRGWFRRSAQEFLKARLLTVSVSTLRRYLNALVGWKWIQTRSRLQNQGGRNHYGVNLRNLCVNIQKNGCSLPDFAIYEVLFSSAQENSEKSKRPDINFNINPNTHINSTSKGENNFSKGRNL